MRVGRSLVTVVELVPLPFAVLLNRLRRELDAGQAVFDLPRSRFVLGDAVPECSVRFHGARAATPLGPAAGPHSQMAQNLVLAWLGGSRILELKTVQVRDDLVIPRPCIDMQNVGFNVEWSQELKLEQSLAEYVKGAMLIEILKHALPLVPAFTATVFDLSVGYDLAGIQSERVQTFIRGMRDARGQVDALRRQIPVELRPWRDLDYPTALAQTVTLSTFHGCPPDEIERIVAALLDQGLHCIVKLNPTLLGQATVRQLLCDELGYTELRTPAEAFTQDTQWDQAVGFIDRLRAKAAGLGLGFGVKLTNTLIVENHRPFFPSTEKVMYLSGPPLHVLAMQLADRLRQHFGGELPISFSAGIDKHNFADAVALGLTPITVCSDLLQPMGYGRLQAYFVELGQRMAAAGAANVADWVLKAHGQADAALGDLGAELATAITGDQDVLYRRWVAAAAVRNTTIYAEQVRQDPRYAAAANRAVPKKIGSQLRLFDCVTCDKCVPVCPNDANFTFVMPVSSVPIEVARLESGAWRTERRGELRLVKKHQIGNFADFCNECGNCDVFCPEDGGPYLVKPRFFGSLEAWQAAAGHDGFFVARDRVCGRFAGADYVLHGNAVECRYVGPGFDVRLGPDHQITGVATGDVDLTYARLLRELRAAVLAQSASSWVAAVAAAGSSG